VLPLMRTPSATDALGVLVAVALLLLTALGNAWVMFVASASALAIGLMLRRGAGRLGALVALAGAAGAVLVGMLFLSR